MKSLSWSAAIFILLLMPGTIVQAQINKSVAYKKTAEEAAKIVAQVLKQSQVVDGHNDLFAWYFGCKYKKLPKCPQDLADYPLDTITKGETDIPRWRKGGVGAVQINVFGDSLRQFLDAYDLLYRMEKKYSKDLKVVSSAATMQKAMQEGKIALLPMLEGSVRLENKLSYLRFFYKQGLRCVTLNYYTTALGDGSDDGAKHNGISILGKEMVQEMNRLGILVDLSHSSAKAMSDILDITTAPVIFSHSNARALCNVNRNVPDDILLRLKENNGLIMLDMVPDHTSNDFVSWMRKGDSVYYTTRGKYPGDKNKLKELMDQWEKDFPRPVVTVSDIADHFDYVKKLIGINHIGIGGDYDGLDYYIKGMEDVSCYPKLLAELARRGWTASELKKITSENYLRVFAEVEKKAVDNHVK